MIAIIDYDIGNVGSVANMLRRLGVASTITYDEAVIAEADKIILPGNGSFDTCMRNLRSTGLVPFIERRVLKDGIPLLAICVGAQMLGLKSEEGVESGLGWLNMTVHRFPETAGLPVPHMGWSDVTRSRKECSLTSNMEDKPRFYFVHSYFMKPANSEDILLKANYGFEFAAAVRQENVIGVQFHPEKSHRFGKQLLAAFAR